METTTKYDTIINFFLDNWIIATIVVAAVVIGFIPSLRDGIKQIYDLIKEAFKKEEFVIKYKDETITFEIMLRSQHFDIVKIHAITHVLGVHSEREWINKYYPDYSWGMQKLRNITLDGNKSIPFDIICISKGNNHKEIYFDLSDFFNESGCTSSDINKFAEGKIKEIYNRKN
ncbi:MULTISPECIES: hypothetical protein [Bacteroidaceae]|jgi:hypothetical protein|nr:MULTISPECIES: hypothetical protein [Bacteroidaceae]EFG16031.1 hypothetical protein CUU_1295 [Phocaeicola vulgatus PC510]MBT9852152.1 hypothetical protein [Phocaeicola vulgatus]MDE5172575.1 hypothetical protein [Bacteroides uniformis]NMW76569.1 hypothetical protein [Phocaeicola vulgatus]